MGWETENYTGSDCTGSSGEKNRVLTLANTLFTVSDGLLVYVSGLALTEDTDFTISHQTSNSTITFLNRLWDDMTIVIKYYQKPSARSISNRRFIQKNIQAFGNTCTITEVTKTTGTDEYRAVSETETDNDGISCWVQVYSEEDEDVKQGTARAGDYVFWFDYDNEDIVIQGNRITFDSKTFEISDIEKHDVGNVTQLIKCRVKQI